MEKITFSEACGMIYARETEKELVTEKRFAEHNNISAFHSCSDRARAFGFRPEDVVQNFRALAFTLSSIKKEKNEEKKKKFEQEKSDIIYRMAEYPEDITLAEEGVAKFGWWAF